MDRTVGRWPGPGLPDDQAQAGREDGQCRGAGPGGPESERAHQDLVERRPGGDAEVEPRELYDSASPRRAGGPTPARAAKPATKNAASATPARRRSATITTMFS